MGNHVINQLHFSENPHTVIPYLRTPKGIPGSPPEFSLNSIKRMPEALSLPLNAEVLSLARVNIALPEFDDKLKDLALAQLFKGVEKKTDSGMHALITDLRKKRGNPDGTIGHEHSKPSTPAIFEQALSNFEKYRFFCQYDWRLTHWGTDLDICSVVASTFTATTSYIEFETSGLPPIAALRRLADTFPSVRFLLQYRNAPGQHWVNMNIFPSLPFGY